MMVLKGASEADGQRSHEGASALVLRVHIEGGAGDEPRGVGHVLAVCRQLQPAVVGVLHAEVDDKLGLEFIAFFYPLTVEFQVVVHEYLLAREVGVAVQLQLVAAGVDGLPRHVQVGGEVLPVRTSILSVHLLSSIACLLSLEGVECPWQKQHLSLYIVRWSVGCALVSSSKRQSRADEVSGSSY